jgi:AraC-like DNA-binding protein
MLVVVLQPYGIYALLRMAATEFNDSVVNLNELFGIDATCLEEQVLSATDTKSRINFIESFLFKKLTGATDPDKVLTGALKLINDHKGNITIAHLLDALPVTERQLERKFKDYTGISPKRFADTIRLQHFLKLLQNHPSNSKIAEAVYEGGYYDQAHLNNYFKRSIGLTPSQYKANNLLAINFMQTPTPF